MLHYFLREIIFNEIALKKKEKKMIVLRDMQHDQDLENWNHTTIQIS